LVSKSYATLANVGIYAMMLVCWFVARNAFINAF